MTQYRQNDPDGDTFGAMLSEPEIGSYLEFPNGKGEPIVRIVHMGGCKVLEHRRYRNILTNEMSDWRPAEKAILHQMTDAQKAEFFAKCKAAA